MKTLILVRHAKSSWGDGSLMDKNRPLDERGKHDAPEMGRRLAKRDLKPDLIMSSPAKRALATARLLAKELDYEPQKIVMDESLYAVTAADLLDMIRNLDDGTQTVMLVGHNPELTELAHALSAPVDRLPTCAVVEFRFDTTSWSDVGKAPVLDVNLDDPKRSRSR